jgi:hypothetical protein
VHRKSRRTRVDALLGSQRTAAGETSLVPDRSSTQQPPARRAPKAAHPLSDDSPLQPDSAAASTAAHPVAVMEFPLRW